MNTETKHTPGPWTINGKAANGYRIDSLATERVGTGFLLRPIAIVPTEDDATLIASAPDMAKELAQLRADKYQLVGFLKDMLNNGNIDKGTYWVVDKSDIELARELIKKHDNIS